MHFLSFHIVKGLKINLDLNLCQLECSHCVQTYQHNGKTKESSAHVLWCVTNHKVSVECSQHDPQKHPSCKHCCTTDEGKHNEHYTCQLSQSHQEHVQTRVETDEVKRWNSCIGIEFASL